MSSTCLDRFRKPSTRVSLVCGIAVCKKRSADAVAAVVADCLPMPQRSVVDSKVLRDSIVNHRRECGNGLADASSSAVAPPCCPAARFAHSRVP